MKVYITYCKDGYGGSEIDKIFDTEQKAIDFIIVKKFKSNGFYNGKDNDYLIRQAKLYIETFEVE